MQTQTLNSLQKLKCITDLNINFKKLENNWKIPGENLEDFGCGNDSLDINQKHNPWKNW